MKYLWETTAACSLAKDDSSLAIAYRTQLLCL